MKVSKKMMHMHMVHTVMFVRMADNFLSYVCWYMICVCAAQSNRIEVPLLDVIVICCYLSINQVRKGQVIALRWLFFSQGCSTLLQWKHGFHVYNTHTHTLIHTHLLVSPASPFSTLALFHKIALLSLPIAVLSLTWLLCRPSASVLSRVFYVSSLSTC